MIISSGLATLSSDQRPGEEGGTGEQHHEDYSPSPEAMLRRGVARKLFGDEFVVVKIVLGGVPRGQLIVPPGSFVPPEFITRSAFAADRCSDGHLGATARADE